MSKFSPTQKRIFVILIVMAIVDFFLMFKPNAAASLNLAMVRMFEPDEAAQLTPLLNMLAPAGSPLQALKNFFLYKYYFYGFPFFSYSALAILPLKLTGSLSNIPQVMLILRQAVSVLPMLIALLMLVYLQDGFRTYRSVVLYVFLLSVPAVLANHFWWHVDSLVFLMIVLVMVFLVKDDLRFGKHFLDRSRPDRLRHRHQADRGLFLPDHRQPAGHRFHPEESPFQKAAHGRPALSGNHGAGLPDLQSLPDLLLGAGRIQADLQQADEHALGRLRRGLQKGAGTSLADHSPIFW